MRTIVAILLGLFINNGYSQGNSSGSSSIDPDQPSLFHLMSNTKALEVPISTEEAIESSLAIVRGRIVSITEGRKVVHNNGYSRPFLTSLIKVEVTKVLKGDVGHYVYFEYLTGGLPAEYMNKHRYTDEIILLLREPGWSKSTYTFRNSSNGLMNEVDTLYSLTTHRGLLIEERGIDTKKVIQPLEDSDPLFLGRSFGDLEKEIPALISGGGYGFDLNGSK